MSMQPVPTTTMRLTKPQCIWVLVFGCAVAVLLLPTPEVHVPPLPPWYKPPVTLASRFRQLACAYLPQPLLQLLGLKQEGDGIDPNSFAVDMNAAVPAGKAMSAAGAQLFAHAAADASDNVLISPFSVVSALTLAWEGAAGLTAEQLLLALGYPPNSDPRLVHVNARSLLSEVVGVQLDVANALWLGQNWKIEDDYLMRTRQLWAEAHNLPFNPEEIINEWVEKQTNNMIHTLLPPGSIVPDTVAVLTNAICFKGQWAVAFDKDNTRPHDFHLLHRDPSSDEPETMPVDMMRHNQAKLRHGVFEDHAMVELPYEGEEVVMLVLLPHDKSTEALAQLTSEQSLQAIGERHKALRPDTLDVMLPRFKFEFEKALKPLLKDMGVVNPFTAEANFSRITPGPVWIDEVYHKAFIDVNEEGTEAAAAAAVVLATESAAVSPMEFVADHPFVFVVYHARLQCPLFIGQVTSPPPATSG